MKKALLLVFLGLVSLQAFSVNESTQFGKIVGIESRSWEMHIQTDFIGGASNGCAVNVGDTYCINRPKEFMLAKIWLQNGHTPAKTKLLDDKYQLGRDD